MSEHSIAFRKTNPVPPWMWGCTAVLLAAIAFRGALFDLVGRWTTEEEYSHGFLIPLVSAWLLWTRRDALLASIARPAWTGPILILLAMFIDVIGQLSSIFVLSPLAFVVALLGIVLATGGSPLLKVAFVPIAFLVFAIPLPALHRCQSFSGTPAHFVKARRCLHQALSNTRLPGR